MAAVSFFLKDLNSIKPTSIYLVFHFNYFELINGKKKFKILKYSTGDKILPEYWDPSTHRVRQTNKFPGHKELNARLNTISAIVEDEYRKMFNDGLKPTPDTLRANLFKRLGRDEAAIVKNMDLFTFIDLFIDDSSSGKRLTDAGKRISFVTIKGYKTTLSHLKKFQITYKIKIDFDTIDLDFYDDFVSYFNKNNLAINTIGKNIKNLKVFMKAAAEKGHHSNIIFSNRRFKTIEEETDSIYLNEDEILAIYTLDLLENKSLDVTRDLFIFGCYSGLRYSDYHGVNSNNIRQNNNGTFLHVKTQKTDELVVIPMNWMLKEVIDKYEGKMPKPFTNQEMNRSLKIIGKQAELDEMVSLSITKGGLRVDTIYKKYELITTHTARRSFATNAYLADIPTISIMKITGHRTEKSFMKYIKMSQEDNANKLIEHPYFSQHKPAEMKKV